MRGCGDAGEHSSLLFGATAPCSRALCDSGDSQAPSLRLWNQGAASGQANFPGKLCQLRCELRVTHFARAARGHRDSGSQGDEDQAEVAATAQKRAGQEEGKAGG